MSHALSFLLFLLGHVAGPKPLAGYDEVVVERVAVEKSCDMFRSESEAVQKMIVLRLRARKLVPVIDRAAADGEELAKAPPGDGVRRMTVSGTVLEFTRGSRTVRSIGIGAGATKLRIRFTFKDAVTGAELFTMERLGRYSGRFNADGGTNEAGFSAAACDVVDGLIADIEKNR